MKFDKMQKILLVDDDSKNTKDLLEDLKSQDYEILVASTGTDVLEQAKSEQPDLILLETALPKMDGYTVCSKLKAEAVTKNIPVILITAWDEGKGLELGAMDYISKPLHTPVIRARVKNYLKLKRQNDRLENISVTDAITGLSTRVRFNEVIEQQWQQAIRGISYLSLTIIEIDDFKQYNAAYGHAGADDCLKQVAQALQQAIGRTTDMVVRYDADKFACILSLTDAKGAVIMAKRFRESVIALNIPHDHSARTKQVSISQGLSTRQPYPNSIPTLLITEAEKALSDAKMRGSNQIVTIW